MKDWNDILAPVTPYRERYEHVRVRTREVLDALKDGEILTSGFLIREIVGSKTTHKTRGRCGRALRALAKHEDGLRDYHTTSEGPNPFRPSEIATRYLWHAYKAPKPKPVCEFCGHELEDPDDGTD